MPLVPLVGQMLNSSSANTSVSVTRDGEVGLTIHTDAAGVRFKVWWTFNFKYMSCDTDQFMS